MQIVQMSCEIFTIPHDVIMITGLPESSVRAVEPDPRQHVELETADELGNARGVSGADQQVQVIVQQYVAEMNKGMLVANFSQSVQHDGLRVVIGKPWLP